jgi:transketolase
MRALPGVEASTGSLGQGLSIGLGHALAGKIDDRSYQVYVMIGDGESQEGQIWEAAMSAAKFGLNNLNVIVDHNGFQQTGPVSRVMPSLQPLVGKWQSFGWIVEEINGHRFEEIQESLRTSKRNENQPLLIIAHTLKGKGLSPFQEDAVNRKHGVALKPEEAQVALAELERMKYDTSYSGEDLTPKLRPEDVHGEV